MLVGPNASGKTTFLDVVGFLSDLLNEGVETAVRMRTSNFYDLTFAGKGGEIQLAVEARIPAGILAKMGNQYPYIRYEVALGIDEDGQVAIFEEAVFQVPDPPKTYQKALFPSYLGESGPLLIANNSKAPKRGIIKNKRNGNANFYPEDKEKAHSSWIPSFNFGSQKSALANLPADLSKFPASTWFREFLVNGVQNFILDSLNIRQASGPGHGKIFKTDGSNLPWVIEDLKKEAPDSFQRWLSHVRTALPDIQNIVTVLREDDKHRYLKIIYDTGIETPSWLASDGTLRLLALTIVAYLPDFEGILLIEEPENGIHPKAVETILESLSSVYNAQILVATHSPVLLSMVDYHDLLCFAKTKEGVTDIVRGNEHPRLLKWRGESNLSTLFASGVLG